MGKENQQHRKPTKKTNRKPNVNPIHPISSESAKVVSPIISAQLNPHLERWILTAYLALVACITYLTTCRTVPGGDSGELISVASVLGVAHPPGYPLYTLLAHLSTALPIGSVAFRVNLLSGLFAIVTAFLIYRVVRDWKKDSVAAFLASGLFTFSPLAWRYAVVAEVFTLNNLFVIALIGVTFRFIQKPTQKIAWVWSAVLGLACTHHHTILFLAIPIFLFLLIRYKHILMTPKMVITCFGVFLIGLLPYLYLPLASQKGLIISWGEAHTWDGFWTHFLRKEYGTFQLATGGRDWFNVFKNIRYYSLDLWHQYLYICIPVIFWGAWDLAKNQKKDFFAQCLLGTWLFYVVGFHFLANMDLSNRLFYDVQSRFWLLPNLILIFFLAHGFILLQKKLQLNRYVYPAIAALLLTLQIGIHFDDEDHSRNTVFYDLGKGILDGLPQNSLLFMRGDVYVNSIRYMQAVEGYRTDVKAIPFDLMWWPWMKPVVQKNFPELKFPGDVYRYKRMRLGEFTLLDFFTANQGRFPTYIGKLADYETQNLSPQYRILPMGFLNKLSLKSDPLVPEAYLTELDLFAKTNPPTKAEIREKSWEAFVYYNYWDREMEKAKFVFEQIDMRQPNKVWVSYGASLLNRVAKSYEDAPPHVFRNLGVAYQLMAKQDPRYYGPMLKTWKTYLAKNPKEDPELPQIEKMVLATEEALRQQQSKK